MVPQKVFDAPQRIAPINIFKLIFISMKLSEMHCVGRVNCISVSNEFGAKTFRSLVKRRGRTEDPLSTFTCLKSAIEKLGKSVKYIQS